MLWQETFDASSYSECIMNRIVVDRSFVNQLGVQAEIAALYDPAGHILGYFTPAAGTSEYEGVDSPASDEEIERRSREGGGRTLTEIMADLERRA